MLFPSRSELFKRVDGVPTLLATIDGRQNFYPWAVGFTAPSFTLGIRVVGDQIQGYYNRNLTITAYDSE